MSYATRAGSVDGKSAVYSGASLSDAAGKLVATNRSGSDKGRLPGKFLADVAHSQSFNRGFEVADNAPGAPQPITNISGLGAFTATCNDQNGAAGNEDPASVLAFNNTSGRAVTVARRVGNGEGAVEIIPNGTVSSLSIGGTNTYTFHIAYGDNNAIIQGAVGQNGRGTAAATCSFFGYVLQIL
ncbi:hypothetical protein OJ997_34455 [Solirubrobacter phytolaccae]|uniref:Uncharacterized protein n=1 Tax=Solirubrobacter phytolaccae TaxID=1404360 RepID=A0A9X3NIC7_9ACTN|nr:hypothetical protein [Solirubrobacter phytolaccae]MDA0185460.1 hypothetical protein [Solirubrobacter phytolaccae]